MIGIVGGVGPYAGIDLLKKIYDNTVASRDQDHLDTALLSLPSKISDRTDYLEKKTDENPAYAIFNVLQKLERIGVTVAGIPCNSAHSKSIFDVIQRELKKTGSTLTLLNMIEETCGFIERYYPDIKSVGVLSTTGTYKSGIYTEILQEKGYRAIVPGLDMQETLIHPSIYDTNYGIKALSNPVHPRALENLEKGLSFLKRQGAEAVILGCTEISLALSQKRITGMIMIDPTNILARALIYHFAPHKLKELTDDL